MKNKPTKHKESNTFKFIPFSERINDIDVDVFHKVSHRNEQDAEAVETYFYQTLQKWNFLNLSECYSNFRNEVRDVITLPQLIYHKQHVIDTLIKYLKMKNPLCLKSILELVVAVARDLVYDFTPYFPEFLSAMIDLLQTKDADQLEDTFTTLAYLFKFLWRYLIKNVDKIFNLLVTLLVDTWPPYVNNFAAESFSFVVRKVKDKEGFLRLVMKTLEEKQSGVSGCGKLLFEVLSGVSNQFHSCAESMLTIYIDALQDSTINQTLLHGVLKEVVNCFVKFIHPQKSSIFWTVTLKPLSSLSGDSLVHLLQLICLAVNDRDGRMLQDALPLARKLVELTEKFESDDQILENIVKLSSSILLASEIKLKQETASHLVIKLLSIQNQDLLLKIVENLIPYSSFEILVLPRALKGIDQFDSNILRLLAKIVFEKAPPVLNGISLDKWKKYNINIRNKECTTYLLNELKMLMEKDNVSENSLRTLIILPHLEQLQEELKSCLVDTMVSLCSRLSETRCPKMCFAALLAVESLVRILEPEEFHDLLSKCSPNIWDFMQLHRDNLSILNCFDMCLTYMSKSEFQNEYINERTFDTIHNALAHKLGTPNCRVRLTVAHIYSLFATIPKFYDSENFKKSPVMLPFLAESEEATVFKYRDRLLHIQSMSFESPTVSKLEENYNGFLLHYLLGNLYVNFSLLWNPVCEIIASYANNQCPEFWSIFLAELKLESGHNQTENIPTFACDVVSCIIDKTLSVKDKVDEENYKLLLWKCMTYFISYCEVKNRDYVGLFIDFVNKCFFQSNSENAKFCSIEKRKETADENSETMEAEDEEDHEVEKPFAKSNQIKLLLAQLEVFAKFSNSRSVYREPELLKIYFDLLGSKNPKIQKASLTCLYTYKHDYLLPYQEHLNNIVDETNLKKELTRFQISEDNSIVLENHRSGLIPIIMRIIHTKMTIRIGMRTGGKTGGSVRRKAILRFLAGVREEEMMIFVRMAFKPFRKYIPLLQETNENVLEFNLKQLVDNMIKEIDLKNVIPPKRLRSAVNLLAIIIEQFGGKMVEKLLPLLLGVLLCILAQVTGILSRAEEVYSSFLTTIKDIRNHCIDIVARFFSHFEDYEWTTNEIDAVFTVAIFPWLEKLPIEGIHSPTPILKLLLAWSHNPRYYPLLVKHHENDTTLTPLPYVTRLLLASKTHLSVINTILEMVEKMLTLQDFEKVVVSPEQMDVDQKANSLMLIVTNKLTIDTQMSTLDMNYGSAILLPHVFNILQYIERKLKKSRNGVNRVELVILSRISELTRDANTSDTLLSLLIPILLKKSEESEEIVIKFITSVINLLKNIEKPEKHIRAIQPLLYSISSIPARKLLMQLFEVVTKNLDPKTKSEFNILMSLNAWDQRWLDQPDFQKRLDSFEEIDSLIEKGDVGLEFGVAVIYNCFFFLKTQTDLAMRDRAGQCLKTIGLKLTKTYKDVSADRHYLIDDTILTMIRTGIRGKSDTLKFQSIAFLGFMAIKCPEVHPVLRDLNLLTNEVDPEVDFFENLQHLQLHRKSRALLKFCTVARSLNKVPNSKALIQFILPLASFYLCNEKFIDKNSIIDASIETIGVICRLVSWNQYEVILKHYLDKLRNGVEFQRQLIRIITVILDSFHFDLSKYKSSEDGANEVTVKGSKKDPETSTAEESGEISKENEEETEVNEEAVEEMIEERLDEVLNEEANDETNEAIEETISEEEKSKPVEEIPAIQREVVLSQYMAKRVVFSISKTFLPQLNRAILARTRHEDSHKVNRKNNADDREEQELMRVPVALAVVKLLQKLTPTILDKNLPGILMKMCTFLKSRLQSVRRATRDILQKIMISLGPDYLHYLLREMNSLLTKGFQVHVLVYTIHAVLVTLEPFLKPMHISKNLQSILSVCKVDMFGPVADEKEVAGIIKNVSEAKSMKSFSILYIMSKAMDETCMLDAIIPLTEVLMKTHSHSTVRKAVEALRQIGLGFADNKFIPTDKMIVFLYGATSESIPQLMRATKPEPQQTKYLVQPKPDSFIIPPVPKNRMGYKTLAKISRNTNAHVMVEFGLRLFHILLKRDKITSPEFYTLLDPFVSILSSCLESQHVKLSTLSLQCLGWILKMDLPSIEETAVNICDSMFRILHKYSVAELSKGDNYDLVMAAFKTMSVLVRDVHHFSINADQLRVLVTYVEQDVHNADKQATSFVLLKAIIKRKLIVPEMHAVMETIAKLSITSENDNVRKQARLVFYSYLMNYPLGKKVTQHIVFYTTQLRFEVQSGRLSAIEMLHSMITGFPLEIISKHAEDMFTRIGLRLVNDDDRICKKNCATCIKELIRRLEHKERNDLFNVVISCLKDKKTGVKLLGAHLCCAFVGAEKEAFESRFSEILPLLVKQFYSDHIASGNEPGSFVKIRKETSDTNRIQESGIKDLERTKDQHLFLVFQVLLKIVENCSGFKNVQHQEQVASFAEHSQYLLAHPHLWVRLGAAQFLSFVLSTLNIEKVKHLLDHPEECNPDDGYIYSSPADTLKSLTLDLTGQLIPKIEMEEFFNAVIKNLIFIAQCLKPEYSEEKKDETLFWLLKKMRKAVNIEITQYPSSTSVRTAVFKWIAGIVVTIPMNDLSHILFRLMSPLVREMATIEVSNAPLRQLAKEVATMIKKKIDINEYNQLLNKVQQQLAVRKTEKKKIRLQLSVTDPQLAAKRKITKQQKKKESRKRKAESMKGNKQYQKRPKRDRKQEIDLDNM